MTLEVPAGETITNHVAGALVVDDQDLVLHGLLSDVGLRHGIDEVVQPIINAGALMRVLKDRPPTTQGFYFEHAVGATLSPAVCALVDDLKR